MLVFTVTFLLFGISYGVDGHFEPEIQNDQMIYFGVCRVYFDEFP